MDNAAPIVSSALSTLQTGPIACALARDVVQASGLDTVKFLQGQLSQDVDGLTLGASTLTFLLAPQGKVEAWMRVTRTAQDTMLLDVDAGYGEAVIARLQRFKLRTRCELELLEPWSAIALRGTGTKSLAQDEVLAATNGTIATDAHWPVVAGFDVLGSDLTLDGLLALGVELVSKETFETLRICCGVPAMGTELDERTIPAEAGAIIIDRSVSFTKGCYTGQELVARVDSRGNNVPQRLVGLLTSTREHLAVGMVLRLAGQTAGDIGRVTSSAASDELASTVALGYLRRAVEVPAEVIAVDVSEGGDPSTVSCTAFALPLLANPATAQQN